ncbi:hypothetical protein BN110_003 [Yersinia phage phiR8-01]|uniref:Uncharacterized protein n=1 Tax=Yersinia phage phiR8-01 TaxID=1206556 RepID=I7LGW3_9CAUD|nr:internal virion protein [Yersinia phage phiR8-01]CCI88384.1 hypothetical protein BN110_003 [Yersinia phage phiR8-01]
MPDQILQSPDALSVPKAQPIQVNAPLAQRAASLAIKPNQAQSRQASDNFAEARNAMESVRQENLNALASVFPAVTGMMGKMSENEFADGFMRQMQGDSVKKIAEEQPFNGLFGDGAAVRGARAAQQMSFATSMDMWVSQNQGELARMGLDEQRRALSDYVNGMATGDEQADLMTAQAAIGRFPAILENLARSANQESQHQAAAQQADAISSHAKSLSWARGEVLQGRMSQDSYSTLQAQAVDMLKPMPGQSEQSYRSQMQGAVLQNMRDGNFDMADLIKDKVLQGQLSPEESMQFDSQVKRARAEWLLDNPSSKDYNEFAMGLPSQIAGGRYNSVHDLIQDMDQMNETYARETGSLTPFIDNEQRGKYMGMFTNYENQAQQNADRDSQKLLDENTKRALYVESYAKGSPSGMAASGLDEPTKNEIEKAQSIRFFQEGAKGPSGEVISRLAAQGYTNKPLKESITRTLSLIKNGAVPSKDSLLNLQMAYQKLEGTKYGMGAVATYFDDDIDIAKSMAHMNLEDPRNVTQLKTMVEARKTAVSVTPEIQKQADELVLNEVTPNFLKRWFGDSKSIGAGYQAALKAELPKQLATTLQKYPNLSDEEAMKIAYSKVMANKDVAGDMLITGSKPGQFINTLNQSLNMKIQNANDPRINAMFDTFVKDKVPHNQGYTVGGITMAGQGDHMFLSLLRDDGTTMDVAVTVSELAGLENSNRTKKQVERNKTEQQNAAAREQYNAGWRNLAQQQSQGMRGK